jgi:hypothetical protein
LEPSLPVQRDGGRPRRIDVESHPLDLPLHAPLHGGRQQRLAVALSPAALLHCDNRIRVAAWVTVFSSKLNERGDRTSSVWVLTGEFGDGGAEGSGAGVHGVPDDLVAVGARHGVDQAGVPALEFVVEGPRH